MVRHAIRRLLSSVLGHNAGMTRALRAGRVPALLVAALLAAPALVACSGGGSGDGSGYGAPEEPSAASGTPSPEPTSGPEVPEGVTPTEAGTSLSFGEAATLVWTLPGGEVGVVDLRVDAMREVPAKEFAGWLGGEALEHARPYYVDVRVTNVGESDLGGLDVPLYLRDENGTLGPPWAFDGEFEPCPSGPLPPTFAPEDRLRACLVFLAPQRAEVDAMAFTPDADFEPVTWTGKVASPRDEERAQDGRKGPKRTAPTRKR